MFTQAAGGRATIRSEFQKGGILMSTYEEFVIILAIANLVVSILTLHDKNKK